MSFVPHSNPNLPKFLEISKLGALSGRVIKYQYFPNYSLTETLTRLNSTSVLQNKQNKQRIYEMIALFTQLPKVCKP